MLVCYLCVSEVQLQLFEVPGKGNKYYSQKHLISKLELTTQRSENEIPTCQ